LFARYGLAAAVCGGVDSRAPREPDGPGIRLKVATKFLLEIAVQWDHILPRRKDRLARVAAERSRRDEGSGLRRASRKCAEDVGAVKAWRLLRVVPRLANSRFALSGTKAIVEVE